MNICDEFNSNCLVRACCTELCEKVGTLVDSYLNHELDYSWIFYELVNNERCPVCHREHFWYSNHIPAGKINRSDEKQIKLACNFCYATYRVKAYSDGEGRYEPSLITQTYQGTLNGQVDQLLTMKEIKDNFLLKRR